MTYADPPDFTAVVSRFGKQLLGSDAEMIEIGSKGLSNTQLPQMTTDAQRQSLYPRQFFYFEAPLQVSRGSGKHIRWVLMRYAFMGIGHSTQRPIIERIAGRQFRLLHDVDGPFEVNGGGVITSCAYDGPINEIQTLGDESFLRIGSRWKIKARLSSSQ